MATAHFTPRPKVVEGVQWDGTNLAEVSSFVDNKGSGPVTDNGDGTITVEGWFGLGENLPAGVWLLPTNASAMSEQALASQYAVLPGGGTYEYTVTS